MQHQSQQILEINNDSYPFVLHKLINNLCYYFLHFLLLKYKKILYEFDKLKILDENQV